MQIKHFLGNLINKVLKLNSEGFCDAIKKVKVQGGSLRIDLKSLILN
jgi:hypothetical protein